MEDQLIIGDKASYTDFGASVATRKIKMPPKKSIKETVPFSNRTYDFSAINGETFWEERELEYVFEITADDPEQLEELKRKFSAWVMGVREQELHDPHIPDYHFLATYDKMELEDDEGLDKTTLTVTFTAYPYMIANTPKVYEAILPSEMREVELQVLNESEHPVSLTVSNTLRMTIKVGDALTATLNADDGTYGALKLPVGLTPIVLAPTECTDPGKDSVNKFNKDSEENVHGYALLENGHPASGPSYSYSHAIAVKGGQWYAVDYSVYVSDRYTACFYDAYGNFVGSAYSLNILEFEVGQYRYFTIPEDLGACFMRVTYHTNSADRLVVAEGSWPGTYVPYTGDGYAGKARISFNEEVF